MPTTKNIPLKILFSLLLLSAFSCTQKKQEQPATVKNPNEITFISLSHVGGTMGKYRIIKITKDSIFVEKGATANQTHKEWTSAINTAAWQQLTSSVPVRDLDKIKSSLSRQPAGEVDETFQIRTSGKSHIFVNSYVDTLHYKQFQQLKERIDKILPKEYQ